MADNTEEWSGTKKATELIQRICEPVKSQVEGQTNKKYVVFKATEYREQVIGIGGGTNYIIKVHVGREDYIHLAVFTNFSIPPEFRKVKLLGVQQHKTKDDPLIPFNV